MRRARGQLVHAVFDLYGGIDERRVLEVGVTMERRSGIVRSVALAVLFVVSSGGLAGCTSIANPWPEAEAEAWANIGRAYHETTRCLQIAEGDYRAADGELPGELPYCFRTDAYGVAPSELKTTRPFDDNRSWLLTAVQTARGLHLEAVSVGYGGGVEGESTADVALMMCWTADIVRGADASWVIAEQACDADLFYATKGIATEVSLNEVAKHTADPTRGS
ncbi:MAG: hypothetical protein HGA51_00585 [Demequinaceae bacterium]|nr:hypothetical protein [Demequinaceae bacterium]